MEDGEEASMENSRWIEQRKTKGGRKKKSVKQEKNMVAERTQQRMLKKWESKRHEKRRLRIRMRREKEKVEDEESEIEQKKKDGKG